MNRTFDRYASIVFLLLGIGFMWQSAKISSSAYGSTVGPNIFPFGLGLALVPLSIRLFYEALKAKPTENRTEKLDYKRFFMIFAAPFSMPISWNSSDISSVPSCSSCLRFRRWNEASG